MVRQPPPLLPQRIVEHDAHVLELGIEVGPRREVERHAHQVGSGRVQVQGADDARQVEALGPDSQGDHPHLALREHDGRGVAEREVVHVEPERGERVRHVAHLVPLAEPPRCAGRWRGAPAPARRRSSTLGRLRAGEGRGRRAPGRRPGSGASFVYPAPRPMSDPRAEFLARAAAGGGGMVPVLREVVLDADTPLAAFVKVARPPFAFLLESLVGGERWARYTFLGTEPREVWRYPGRGIERWTRPTGWQAAGETDDPIGHVAQQMRALPAVEVPGLPRFTGGAVGYLGYDLVRTVERLPRPPADTLAIPDAMLLVADTVVILDNLFGRAIVVANVEVPPGAAPAERLRLYDAAEARLDEMVGRLRQRHELSPLALRNGLPPVATESRYTRAAFERDVARVLEYVAAGDTFQTVLSRRQEVRGAVDPLLLYRYLRALNPAPYLFSLALDDFTLVGSSPEVLVRVEGGEVTVRPIAGTRPRGRTREEDEALANELRADEKERAEHMMLVDLGRNDVGRVARFGSVRVTDLLTIERYSHVQHLVSEVRGQLRDGYDALDVFKACFPAGTVTGAPKVRAMAIIDELEPERRGPYAGAVGYVGWGAANLDTAIAIRCALVRRDRVVVQAGAGIVADSDPAREFRETEDKAQAVLKALALAKAGG